MKKRQKLLALGIGLTAATIFSPIFGIQVSIISNYVAVVGWILAVIGLLIN